MTSRDVLLPGLSATEGKQSKGIPLEYLGTLLSSYSCLGLWTGGPSADGGVRMLKCMGAGVNRYGWAGALTLCTNRM